MTSAAHTPSRSAIALAAALILGGCAAKRIPDFVQESCPATDAFARARCGVIEVAEDRASAAGRRINLAVAVLPRRELPGKEDPVFVIVGGPGQSAIASMASYARLLEPLNLHRDLVFVDQRGTGRSNPLQCQIYDGTRASLLGDFLPLERVKTCREELAAKADLRQYTTDAAAHDLDDVRRSLGYGRINLEAASYGTRLVLLYLRHHGAHVRAAVMRSVSPPSMRQPLSFDSDAQAALDSLIVDCENDATCASRFPSFRSDVATVLHRVERGDSVVIKRGPFAEKLRLMLYANDVAAYLPLLFERARTGDYSMFLELAAEMTQTISAQIWMGMYLSVSCAEDVAQIPDTLLKPPVSGFLGDYRVQQQRAACSLWPAADIPADFAAPVRSSVPVLIISSDVDPITPPRWAATAATGLTRARQVVIRRASHSPSNRCAMSMVWTFIEAADTAAVDSSCAAQSTRPPFQTAIPR